MAWFKVKKDTVDQTDVVKMLRADLIALDTAHTKVLGTHATLLDGLRRDVDEVGKEYGPFEVRKDGLDQEAAIDRLDKIIQGVSRTAEEETKSLRLMATVQASDLARLRGDHTDHLATHTQPLRNALEENRSVLNALHDDVTAQVGTKTAALEARIIALETMVFKASKAKRAKRAKKGSVSATEAIIAARNAPRKGGVTR